MFIQFMRGKAKDAAELERLIASWNTDLRPKAVGFLGSTYGTSPDGTFVAIARFESAEAAAKNSGIAEQAAWWSKMEQNFDGPVTFVDCADVDLMAGGGRDDAGFVQVMVSKVDDPGGYRALTPEFEKIMPTVRSDVLGGVTGFADDGTCVEAIYFQSESAARSGESADLPPDATALLQKAQSMQRDTEYLDLTSPKFF